MLHRRSRGPVRALAALALAALVLASTSAHAQRNYSGLPSPRLYQVFPPGARAGTTVEVLVSGRHLEDPQKLVFTNPAVKAEHVPSPKPEIDPKTKKPRPVMGALPPDTYRFKVTVPAGTPPGSLDVRVVNKWGASNARTFVVGDLEEVNEKEPNNDTNQAQRINLNTTVNGTIAAPADVDYYVFSAKKGQRVVLVCRASSIDSRLNPAIEVYNDSDQQIAGNRNYQGDDAVADFTAPADGDYHVRVFQFTHTFRQPIPGGLPPGSSDYYYRLSVTTAPWVDSVVPSVIEPGKTADVTVYGRNLPGGKLDPTVTADDSVLEKITMKVTAPADGKGKLTFSSNVMPAAGYLDGFELRVRNDAGTSNPYLIGLARAPVVLDRGDNDSPDAAQEITLPCEIAGVVEKRRDRDWFTFTAKRGESWNIEVISNRLGAPTFMTILVRNPATKSDMYESPLVENMQRLSRKFFSRSEDPPLYRFTAPADGKYQLLVASRAGDTLFGVRHTYAVRITRDDPDFRLVALTAGGSLPDVPAVPVGGQGAYNVLVRRSGGFSGDVELSVEGLPPGVTCPPQVLGAGVNETTLAFSAPPDAPEWAGEIKIKGTATINGAKVVQEARAGGILWPVPPNNNIATLSRLERSLWLAVAGKAPFTLTPALDKPQVTQGDKAVVSVKVARLWPEIKNAMQVSVMQSQNRQGSELPINLRFNNNQPVNVAANQPEAKLNVTVGLDVPPGTYNVVFRGQTQAPYNKDPMAKQKPNTFIVQPSAPISITVLPKSLAQFTLSTNQVQVKAGAMGKLVVRVARRFNYDGEFKVQLVLPQGVTGVEATEVTIPAGKNEAELVVRIPAGTNPGNRTNLVVRATAQFNGKFPTTHEAKLNVNVVK
jgi:hypothetical protein